MTRPARWIAACLAAAATFVTSHARAEKLLLPDDAPAGEVRVYFGTYTGKSGSKGIYVSTLDLATGKLSPPELAGETTNPSFLAIHPSKRFLYAVGEVNEINGKKAGAVSAFAIQPDGKLSPLNQQPSGGQGPCHVSVDKEGRNVLVANYGSGAVGCLPIGADGKLAEPSATVQHEGKSVDPRRQAGPHAHSINLDPANRFAFAADLGLDKVLVYRFDAAAGKLTPSGHTPTRGKTPRNFNIDPTGTYLLAANQGTSTVAVYRIDPASGALAPVGEPTAVPAPVCVKYLQP